MITEKHTSCTIESVNKFVFKYLYLWLDLRLLVRICNPRIQSCNNGFIFIWLYYIVYLCGKKWYGVLQYHTGWSECHARKYIRENTENNNFRFSRLKKNSILLYFIYFYWLFFRCFHQKTTATWLSDRPVQCNRTTYGTFSNVYKN